MKRSVIQPNTLDYLVQLASMEQRDLYWFKHYFLGFSTEQKNIIRGHKLGAVDDNNATIPSSSARGPPLEVRIRTTFSIAR